MPDVNEPQPNRKKSLPKEQRSKRDNSTRRRYTARLKKVLQEHPLRFFLQNLLFPVLVGIITFITAKYFGDNPITTGNITTIDGEAHHLGDVRIESFLKPNHEGSRYSKEFMVTVQYEQVEFCLDTRHVDPNVEIPVFINGKEIGKLNEKVDQEKLSPPIPIRISFDPNILKIGSNNIMIEANPDPFEISISDSSKNEFSLPLHNIDDFEFWNLRLEGTGRKSEH